MDADVGVVGFAGNVDGFAKGVGHGSPLPNEAGGVIVFCDDEKRDVTLAVRRQFPDHHRVFVLDEGIDEAMLLDTPGILPMNYPDGSQAVRLALLGSIKEEVLPNDDLAVALLAYLKTNYPT